MLFGRHDASQPRGGAGLALPCPFRIDSERDGHTHHLRLAGELDLATAHQLEEELVRVEATDASRIVVDLGGLELIDSVGLQVFIRAGTRARQGGDDRLALVRGRDSVHRVFEICGLVSRMPFTDAER